MVGETAGPRLPHFLTHLTVLKERAGNHNHRTRPMYSGTPTQVTKPWTMFAVDGGIQIQTISDAGYQEDDPAIQEARKAGFEVDDAGWLCHQGHRIRCHVTPEGIYSTTELTPKDPTNGYGPPPWAPWEI